MAGTQTADLEFERMAARFTCVISALALAAGCGSPPPIAAPNVRLPQARAPAKTSYRTLYGFRGTPDGARPTAALLDVNGTFYGTTWFGGAYDDGTVFTLTKAGVENVLHSFNRKAGADGGEPATSLIAVNGTLYGTTYYGGAYNRGTLFSITTSGDERVLHSFGSGTDGQTPQGTLLNIHGTLYGTTGVGGGANWGTVFRVTPSRSAAQEHIVYNFHGSDGGIPESGVVEIKGKLYGTTRFGGTFDPQDGGAGTVFSLTLDGTEAVLHDFGSGFDGAQPESNLIDLNGTLYGTTLEGGAYSSDGAGGTVFGITTAGVERVLHSFGDGADGIFPSAGLVDVRGTLYGTTYEGGARDYGTIFAMSTSGSETVLHDFSGRPDGGEPAANLIDANGKLYGTAYIGGKYGPKKLGGGTVFELAP
jgi:uncharacterized repeat protein (TIGR03803 family)